MNQNEKYVNFGSVRAPSSLRRLVAALLDFLLFVVLSASLFVFVAQPLATLNSTYQMRMVRSQTILVQSGLFYQTEHGIVKIYNYDDSYTRLDSTLENFYCTYALCDDYSNIKKAQILQSPSDLDDLFYFDDASQSYLGIEQKKASLEMKNWLKGQIDLATTDVLQQTPAWRDAFVEMLISMSLVIFITSVFSSFCLYFLFPVFNFGQTIGHRLMGLSIYSIKQADIKPSIVDLIVRYLAFAIIQLTLGFMSLGIIPLVSFFLSAYGENKMGFHDRMSQTKVVDFHENQINGMDSFAKKALYGEENQDVL